MILEAEQTRQLRILIFAASVLCALIVGYNAYYVPDAPLSQPFSAAFSGGSSLSADSLAAAAKLNLNTATAQELSEGLPGIGEAIAARIVAYREEHGPFRSPEELKNVEGVGEKKFEQIKDFIVTE
jgi:competence protein ComEA